MQLSESQRLALRAFITNDPTLGPKAVAGDYDFVANGLNAAASPAYYGIRTDASRESIRNAVQWPKFTPAPAITSGNAAQASAASNYCMGKLTVLQLLGFQATGSAGGTFDATNATQTNGLKDAVTSLPSAAAFANQDANWTGQAGCIANQLVRPMTVAEKALKVGAGGVAALNDGVSALGTWNNATGLGNPDAFGAQGSVAPTDIGGIIA